MRFAAAPKPWTADDVLLALADQALRRGHTFDDLRPEQIRTRPAVLLAGLLRGLDVEADHPSLVEQNPEEPPIPEHDCDHGWVNVITESGREGVTRCAGGVRCAQLHAREFDAEDDVLAEPPF